MTWPNLSRAYLLDDQMLKYTGVAIAPGAEKPLETESTRLFNKGNYRIVLYNDNEGSRIEIGCYASNFRGWF